MTEPTPASLAGSEGAEPAPKVGLPAGFTMTDEWCADHGYGCEPDTCPCGHTLRCDCVGIANER